MLIMRKQFTHACWIIGLRMFLFRYWILWDRSSAAEDYVDNYIIIIIFHASKDSWLKIAVDELNIIQLFHSIHFICDHNIRMLLGVLVSCVWGFGGVGVRGDWRLGEEGGAGFISCGGAPWFCVTPVGMAKLPDFWAKSPNLPEHFLFFLNPGLPGPRPLRLLV